MNANYTEICRVGYLEADFQIVPHVKFFLKFSQYCCDLSIIKIQQRKVKSTFVISFANPDMVFDFLYVNGIF